ncbi:MAG: hypothetical protein AAFX79_12085 [Planctomycetota bacterium]
MPGRVVRYYQRKRVVNINVNLVAAGLLAIALAKGPVALISGWLGSDQKFLISLIAYAIDTVFDVAVYFGLHWVANHWRPRAIHKNQPRIEKPRHRRNFFADAGRVQAERLALVPVFAVVSMGLMYGLQKYGDIRASWAFVFGFVTAILVTRTLHTISGIWTGTFRDDEYHYGVGTEPGFVEQHEREREAEEAREPFDDDSDAGEPAREREAV